MTRAAPLHLVVQHVRAQARPNSHSGVLLRRIEELEREAERWSAHCLDLEMRIMGALKDDQGAPTPE